MIIDTNIADQFPGLAGRCYLDTAAGACSPRVASDALSVYAQEKLSGSIDVWRMEAVETEARARTATLMGCTPEEIAFVPSTTHGINTILSAIRWQPGDNVVTTDLEFPSVMVACLHLGKTHGVEVRIVRHVQGIVETEVIARQVNARTRAVVISHVSFNSGQRFDLNALAECAHRHGALLVVDASQSAGAVQLNLAETPVDALAACTRKWLLGSHGLAFLYCRQERLPELQPAHTGWRGITNFLGAAQTGQYTLLNNARRFETGTVDYGAVYAYDASLRLLMAAGPAAVESRVLALSGALIDALQPLGVRLLTPTAAARRAGIVSFATPDYTAIRAGLEAQNIYVWAKDGRVRASAHFYNRLEDTARLAVALRPLLSKGRK